ncbi:ATP synthase [Candidatus Desulforudis audaxviator]|nr:ATP synthase [Candidatus Desulforudis audaxviator]
MRRIRIVEAYVGEYAGGKSEVAVNRALELAREGEPVTLVDLDTVEPCYTLRPLQEELAAAGIHVVAWETRRTLGLGEAGGTLKAEARWVLRRPGHVIFDVGYGVGGARILNLVEGAEQEPSFTVLAVINASRPLTATVEDIAAHVRALGSVHALINNTHLGSETTAAVVQAGAALVAEAGRILGIPVAATTAPAAVAAQIGPRDAAGHPVRPLRRFMPRAFW